MKTWMIRGLRATWFETSAVLSGALSFSSDLSGFNNHKTNPEGMAQGREKAPHLTIYSIYTDTAPVPQPSFCTNSNKLFHFLN